MLTLVVPESGSAAAALRAIVNAGRKFNDACCAWYAADWVVCREVEGAWARAQKI
jgi:hypothetical protein